MPVEKPSKVVEVPQLPVVLVAAPPLRIKVRLAHPSNYSKQQRMPLGVVLHATHGAEGPLKDDDEAAALQKPDLEKSFHYVCDSNSATRCVPDMLTAWHSHRSGNKWGIGVEICGMADQTRSQWLDPVSLATLGIAARLVADICQEHRLPPVFVSPEGLRAGQRGITTHHAVSLAWRESDHWDPGPHFPLDEFIDCVARSMKVSPVT